MLSFLVEFKRSTFKLEKEMVEPVRSAICRSLGLDPAAATILTTPSIGQVIPDLLVASWGSGKVCSRASITHTEAALLSPLDAKGTMRLSEIRKQIILSEVTANRCLNRLTKIGAITRLDSGEIRINDIMRTNSMDIIAIELKMNRWKEALEQAISYQAFSDQAYVVLDAAQVNLNERIFQEFERANVGLLLQDETKLARVIRCASRLTFSPDRLIASQKLKRLNHAETITHLSKLATSDRPLTKPFDDVHQSC